MDRFVIALIVIIGGITGFVLYQIFSSEIVGIAPLSYENNTTVGFIDTIIGKPILTNPDVTVYYGFNNTIDFDNNLNHNLLMQFRHTDDNDLKKYVNVNQSIMSGQTFRYTFFTHYDNNATKYNYTIEPDDLHGTVTVKQTSDCYTMNDLKSIYSNVNVILKFPQYLPTEYEFKCGRVIVPSEVFYFYDNKNVPLIDTTWWSNRTDFFKKDGLVIDYMIEHGLDYNSTKDKVNIIMEKGGNPPHSAQNYTEFNGDPAIIGSSTSLVGSQNIHGSLFVNVNRIAVYTKTDVFSIIGNVTMDELKKVASSMR